MNKGSITNKNFTSILLFMTVLLLSGTVVASDELDTQRPEGVSDKKWSSLKTAVQEAKLFPDTPGIGGPGSVFGYSVSVDGDRALVGAPQMMSSGMAMVFEFDGVNWHQMADIQPTDGGPADNFGRSVSLSGNRALIGASFDDDNGLSSGSAYVFDYDGKNWLQNKKLTPSDGERGDYFGNSVSLEGNRILIGAYKKDNNLGAAYLFDYDGNDWIESAKLITSDGSDIKHFGYSVSSMGDRVVVSALTDLSGGTQAGSAYVFDFDGMSWIQSAKLTASDGSAGDMFGYSVS